MWNVNEVNYCDLIPRHQNIKYFISIIRTVHINGIEIYVCIEIQNSCLFRHDLKRKRNKKRTIFHQQLHCMRMRASMCLRLNIRIMWNWFSADLTFWDWQLRRKFITGYLWFSLLFLNAVWMQICDRRGWIWKGLLCIILMSNTVHAKSVDIPFTQIEYFVVAFVIVGRFVYFSMPDFYWFGTIKLLLFNSIQLQILTF